MERDIKVELICRGGDGSEKKVDMSSADCLALGPASELLNLVVQ